MSSRRSRLAEKGLRDVTRLDCDALAAYAQDSNTDAANELYKRCTVRFRQQMRGRGVQYTDQQDIFAEVFSNCLRKFRPSKGSFLGFFSKSVENRLMSFFRANSRRKANEERVNDDAGFERRVEKNLDDNDPAADMAHRLIRDQIETWRLTGKTRRCRWADIAELRYVDEMALGDIAALLNLTYKAVENVVLRNVNPALARAIATDRSVNDLTRLPPAEVDLGSTDPDPR
jgi:RNA polymerase sigma factor (sigma-70 family)